MKKQLAFLTKTAFILSLFGCIDFSGNSETTIEGFNLARGQAGDNITIYGHSLDVGGTPSVLVNGVACAIVSTAARTVVVTLPVGVTGGELTFGNVNGTVSGGSFFVGPTAAVPEVEPNDDINGGDATLDRGNRLFTGTLSGVGDKDHFRLESTVYAKVYKIHIEPAVVNTIYVNGTGVPVDGSGNAEFLSAARTNIIGITGGTGDYTISVTMQP